MKRFFYGILGAWILMTYVCQAAPEPAIVPALGQWTVESKFTHPQNIIIPQGSDNQPKRFWYMIITLTNNTGIDFDFFPKCDLMTDTFQVIPAGKSVSPVVFQQIQKRHKRQYPFLEPLDHTGNKILQGEDNTKDIAIIWPDYDAQAKGIKVFITGLSNETVAVDHPVAKDDMGKPLQIFLRKTLEIDYTLMSDPALRSNASLAYKEKRWIMR